MPTMDDLRPDVEEALGKYKKVYNQYVQDIRAHLSDKYGIEFDVLQIREDLGNLQFIAYTQPSTHENIICTCTLKMGGQIQDDYVYQRAMAEIRDMIINRLENIEIPSVVNVSIPERPQYDQGNILPLADYIKTRQVERFLIAVALQTNPENEGKIKDLLTSLLAAYNIKTILGLYFFNSESFQALKEPFQKGIHISFNEMRNANPLHQSTVIVNS